MQFRVRVRHNFPSGVKQSRQCRRWGSGTPILIPLQQKASPPCVILRTSSLFGKSANGRGW